MKRKSIRLAMAIVLSLVFVLFFIKYGQNQVNTANSSTTQESVSTNPSLQETQSDTDALALDNRITADNLNAALEGGNPPTVISLQPKAVYDDGHIIGAINMPYAEDLTLAYEALDKSGYYVLYGASDQVLMTADQMSGLGFKVAAFTDGLLSSDGPNSWMNSGYPIISSVIKAEKSTVPSTVSAESNTSETESISTLSSAEVESTTQAIAPQTTMQTTITPQTTMQTTITPQTTMRTTITPQTTAAPQTTTTVDITESTAELSTATTIEMTTEIVIPSEHIVQSGDTIYKIGRKYGIAPANIIAINQLADPSALVPGQVIRLK